jgi:hypothetical protein
MIKTLRSMNCRYMLIREKCAVTITKSHIYIYVYMYVIYIYTHMYIYTYVDDKDTKINELQVYVDS